MTFRPKMRTFVQGFSLLEPLACRVIDGMVLDHWSVSAGLGAGGHYVSPDPRVVIILSGNHDRIAFRTEGNVPCPAAPVAYIPQGAMLWSETQGPIRLAHLDLHFRLDRLHRILGRTPPQQPLFTANPQVQAIASLLAAEVRTPTQPDAYTEALVTALALALFGDCAPETARGGITPAQMRKLVGLVESALPAFVPNAELAAAIGLSEGWFITAFRDTTGSTPHRWQTEMRIARAMQIMTDDPDRPLAGIAVELGFADQPHLTRNFKAITGIPRSRWRRLHVATPAT